jgi:hypothetical protein
MESNDFDGHSLESLHSDALEPDQRLHLTGSTDFVNAWKSLAI